MTTTTSQIGAVIQQIYDTLSARPGLAGVRIFRRAASPRDLSEQDELLVIAQRVTGEQEFPFASKRVKRDDIRLESVIYVRMSGADDDAADDVHTRVEEIFGEVEDALRTDPGLTRNGKTILQVTTYEHTFSGDDSHRIQSLAFTISGLENMVST